MLFHFIPGGGIPLEVDSLPRAAPGAWLRMPEYVFRPREGRDGCIYAKLCRKIVLFQNNDDIPSIFLNSCSNMLSFQAHEKLFYESADGARDVSRLEASFFPDRGTLNLLGVAKMLSPAEGEDETAIWTSAGLQALSISPTGLHPLGGTDSIVCPLVAG